MIDRRSFLQSLAVAPALLLPAAPGRPRFPVQPLDDAKPILVGALVPAWPDGDAASGVVIGAEESARAATMLGRTLELRPIAVSSPASAGAAADRLFSDGAPAIVGHLDAGAAAAVDGVAVREGRAFVSVGSAREGVRPGTRATWHVSPGEEQLLAALAAWLASKAGREGWFYVGPGGAGNRERRERTRRAFERAGAAALGEAPAPSGTAGERALVRRIAGSGAAVAFVDLPETGFARFARACADERPAFVLAAPGTEPGGETATPAAGAFGAWPVAWDHRLTRFGAAQLNARYRERFHREMTADAWAGWMAVKLVADAVLRTPRAGAGTSLGARLSDPVARFDGHKGRPLTFDAARQLLQPCYVVHRPAPWLGGEEAVHEVDA